MKHMFLVVLAVFICISCNPANDSQPEKEDALIPLTRVSETNLFPTLAGYSNRKEMEAIRKNGDISPLIRSENDLYQKVHEIFDFEVKTNNQGLEEERGKAKIAYHKFIKTHEKDVILVSQFRDQYAKRLLLDYKILESDRYEDMEYFTKELIESHLGNYELILRSLAKLEGNIDQKQFARLLQKTHQQVNESVSNEKILKIAIADMIRQKEAEAIEQKKLAQNEVGGTKPRKRLMLSLLKENQKTNRSELLEGYLVQIKKFESSLAQFTS